MKDKYTALWIEDETAPLETVLLGTAEALGPPPDLEEAYDPLSRGSLQRGTYPNQSALAYELAQLKACFAKHQVTVLHPAVVADVNQVFARDIAFVIGDKLVRSNIIPDRQRELQGLENLIPQIDPDAYIVPPPEVHIEGGDVVVWNDHLFVGVYTGSDYPRLNTARTNAAAIHFLRETFPDKTVKSFELAKSNTDPLSNTLHLDCAFQPVGNHRAILYKEGFSHEKEYFYLLEYFGVENVFEVSPEEAYHLTTNVFSITPETVVVEAGFKRLKAHMEVQWNLRVETVSYSEIEKMGGLLRCTTLPLKRRKTPAAG